MHEAKPAQVPAAWVFTLPWLVGACKPDIEKTEEFVTDPACLLYTSDAADEQYIV